MVTVLWPFLRPTPMEAGRTDWSRAALRAALAAVDKDEARGILSADDANRQRADIAAKARAALGDSSDGTSLPRSRKGLVIAGASLCLAPVIVFGAYLTLGTPDPSAAQKRALASVSDTQQEVNFDALIKALDAQLETRPDDSQLWARLADIKIRKEDFTGAEAALERAVALPFSTPQEGAQLWLILAMTRRTQGVELSDPLVAEPLKKSLALDETSPAAILLARIEDEARVEATGN